MGTVLAVCRCDPNAGQILPGDLVLLCGGCGGAKLFKGLKHGQRELVDMQWVRIQQGGGEDCPVCLDRAMMDAEEELRESSKLNASEWREENNLAPPFVYAFSRPFIRQRGWVLYLFGKIRIPFPKDFRPNFLARKLAKYLFFSTWRFEILSK